MKGRVFLRNLALFGGYSLILACCFFWLSACHAFGFLGSSVFFYPFQPSGRTAHCFCY